VSDQLASRPGLKTACFWKIYPLNEFLSYRGVIFLFENLKTRAKKSREQNVELWGRA
jgi:hypothetical protein